MSVLWKSVQNIVWLNFFIVEAVEAKVLCYCTYKVSVLRMPEVMRSGILRPDFCTLWEISNNFSFYNMRVYYLAWILMTGLDRVFSLVSLCYIVILGGFCQVNMACVHLKSVGWSVVIRITSSHNICVNTNDIMYVFVVLFSWYNSCLINNVAIYN